MKRILLLLMVVCSALTVYPFEYTYQGKTLQYEVIDEQKKTCEVGRNRGIDGEVVLPEFAYDGDTKYTVVQIGKSAFQSCTGLRSICIPNSVTSIGEYAYFNCTGLTSVSITNSVTSIGGNAFSWCTGLRKAEFGSIESLCAIEFGSSSANPLYYAHNLYINGCEVKDIVIPNTVTSIGPYAFSGGNGLTSVSIPNSVTSIGQYAFDECTWLRKAEFGSIESLCAIEFGSPSANPLYHAHNLYINGCEVKDIVIPNTVTSIGPCAFSGGNGLTSVSIPNSVTSIGKYAFSSCTGLRKAEFASIESLCAIEFGNAGSNPLANANHLYINGVEVKDVVIPNTVKSVKAYTFWGGHYNSIRIPNSVAAIGEKAFGGNSDVTKVICEAVNPPTIEASAFSMYKSQFYTYYYGTLYVTEKSIGNYREDVVWRQFHKIKILGDLNYKFDESAHTCSVTGFDVAPEGTLSIPDQKNGYKVVSIGEGAFANCDKIKVLILPATLQSIEDRAFAGCSSLDSIITNATTPPVMKESAFSNYSKPVVSVPINSLRAYKRNAAWGKFSIIVDSDIFNYDFSKNANTCSVIGYRESPSGILTIPEEKDGCKVTGIGPNAFANCNKVQELILPASIQSIEDRAFAGCSGIESVTCYAHTPPALKESAFSNYSKAVLYVPDDNVQAFKENTAWRKFNKIDNISILKYSFNDADNTCGVTGYTEAPTGILQIPQERCGYKVTSIGEKAFSNCSKIESVVFPETLTTIGDEAFYICGGIKRLELPASLANIGKSAFNGCSGITQIECKASEPPAAHSTSFTYYSGVALMVPWKNIAAYRSAAVWKNFSSISAIDFFIYKYNEGDKTCSIVGFEGSLPDGPLEIPATKDGYRVTEIGANVFSNCANITSVKFPAYLQKIGDRAFSNCTGLTTLSLPSSLQVVGDGAFNGCSGVKTLTLEDGNTELRIGNNNGLNALEVLNLGRDVTATLSFQGLKTLTIINISKTVKTIPENLFYECSSLRSLTVPESVEVIGERAFYGCVALKSINIQDGSTPIRIEASTLSDGRGSTFAKAPIQTIYMGRNVEYTSTELSPFKNISELTDLTIGNKVTAINNYLFYGCTNIANMAVPSSVKTIGDYSFYDCTNSTLLIISSSVESIGEYAFYNCRGLKSLTIPNSVLTIGDYAFRSCVGAEKIKIGNGVKEIGAYAFLDCRAASEITIGEKVEKIGSNAFYNCNMLQEIIVPNSVVSIGANAFALCVGAEKATIGAGVKTIGSRAFGDCQSLKEVVCMPTTPPTADETTFSDYSPVLTVPTNCLNAYKNSTSNCWPLFKTIKEEDVKIIEVERVEVSPAEMELKEEEQKQLTATVYPSNATYRNVTWSTSASTIATVDQNGLVTGIKAGVCTITATASNGVSASCKVTVVGKGSIAETEFNTKIGVKVSDGVILVNAPDDSVVEVYTVGNVKIASTTEHRIEGLDSGIYIVRVQGKAFKVIL